MEQVQTVVDLILSIISGIVLLGAMTLLIFMTIKAHKAEKEHERIMKELEKQYRQNIEETLSFLNNMSKDKEEVVPKKRGRKKKVEE